MVTAGVVRRPATSLTTRTDQATPVASTRQTAINPASRLPIGVAAAHRIIAADSQVPTRAATANLVRAAPVSPTTWGGRLSTAATSWACRCLLR